MDGMMYIATCDARLERLEAAVTALCEANRQVAGSHPSEFAAGATHAYSRVLAMIAHDRQQLEAFNR